MILRGRCDYNLRLVRLPNSCYAGACPDKGPPGSKDELSVVKTSDSTAPTRIRRLPEAYYGNAEDSLGYPPGSGQGFASGQEQTDCVRELANKLAWAIGSTYRKRYSTKKSPTFQLAQFAALAIVRQEGYSKSE